MKISKKGVRILYDFANIVFGSFLFGMGMNMFMVPGEIVLGGFTGIATVLNILFSFPIGFTVIVLNIPPLLINGKLFGFDFFKRTIVGIITTSVAVDTLTMFPVTIEDPLLCSLFGGAIVGLGAGILLSKGYTTGGTDLIAWPIKNKIKRLSTGTAIMIIDFAIVLLAAVALKNFEGIFYSVIATVVFSKIIDMCMYN